VTTCCHCQGTITEADFQREEVILWASPPFYVAIHEWHFCANQLDPRYQAAMKSFSRAVADQLRFIDAWISSLTERGSPCDGS
jgi:hypothetical protein